MRFKVVVVDLEISGRAKRWGARLLLPALVLSATALALAAPVTFSRGQALSAADLNNNFAYLVPSGAVVAFNLAACPVGWTAVSAAGGRTIIGVNAVGGNGLAQRNLGDLVGEETHTLSVNEMPSHTHVVDDPKHGHTVGPQGPINQTGQALTFDPTAKCGLNCTSPMFPQLSQGMVTSQSATGITLEATGGGVSFNNMQPSLAFLYCQKD